jgi:predicted DNA-binding ribbon-helix-helix protein
MCQIYANADAIIYESRTRSLRIHNVLTTIRLENLFWDVLSEMSAREGLSTNEFISKLHDELVERRGEAPNFASFLRVCCLRYLSLLAGRLEAPTANAPLPKVLHAVN